MTTHMRVRLAYICACSAVLAAATAGLAVEATDASLPVKVEFVAAKTVQYATRVYRRGAVSRPRTIARRYGLRISVRVSNGSSDALRSITLEGVYLDANGDAIRRTHRQLTIEPALQPGEARVIEFEDDFGTKPPSSVQGFAGKVVDMNFVPETVTIARDGKLYAEPRPDARVTLAIPQGTKLERRNWWRDWYQVKAPTGEIGWIHTSLLPLAIFVDRRQVAFEAPPQERDDGRITVLLLPLATALGAEVKWHEETQSILILRGSTQIQVKQNSAEALVIRDDQEPLTLKLPEPLRVKRGKSFIDLEWLCRRLGAGLKHDPVSHSVDIETRPQAPGGGALKQA